MPLSERRDILHDNVQESRIVACCDGVVGKGKAFFKATVAAGHEGVVAKRLTSRYMPNHRGREWQKVKPRMELPCAVIGYRAGPEGVRDLVMASVVDDELAYVGTVELGVDAVPRKQLESLRVKKPVIRCSLPARWVKPELLCVVRFAGWRPGGWWRDATVRPLFASPCPVSSSHRHDAPSAGREAREMLKKYGDVH